LASCAGCYYEEQHGYESRRVKENFKSVIFTELSFDRSFEQSPGRDAFVPVAKKSAIDWHVDLGNECNLSCKMCNPKASSKISSAYVKWGLIPASANQNWTANATAWDNFKKSILATPGLNRMHFMGGEPLLNKRFPELLDFLLDSNPTMSISFVSNGTMINESIVERLKQFRTCDIEISLESIHSNNHYIRQGSVTSEVINNIKWLCTHQSDQFQVVLRCVPQLLNVNNYDQYLRWAWQHNLSVQGIPLTDPAYLQISVLPYDMRQQLIPQYTALADELQQHVLVNMLTTGRNVKNLAQGLLRECNAVISMLTAPEPDNVVELRKQLIHWLVRWDREFGLDAREFYPEYNDFLVDHGYQV
jgi:sulfatase maturation enzyme AslB (radical SAM superfamily)